MTTIGYATLQVIPSMRGTTATMNQELGGFKTAGRTAGQQLAAGITDGVKTAEAGLAQATKEHRKFNETARAAAARRAVEVEKLNELQAKGITTGSRWLAQQERVTASRNRERDAVLSARTALDNMTAAQKRATDATRAAETGSRRLGLGLRSVSTEAQAASRSTTGSLQQIAAVAETSGSSAGHRFVAGLGVLKVGAAAVGAAGGAAVGVAFSKGLQRLTAIDDAKGKLTALGHSTQSTAKIMDSALASVKGTSYGLGDAANIAASAVAAGIKPGEQLTKYLGMTADAAAIAGVGLNEMGSILNKVQTGTVAYTGDLNMLADRGIPIYQWLQQEMGVSAAELKDMVSKGKVDSATYFRAIEKNIGGAAKTIGSSTVRGAWDNLGAAMGRIGAAALSPTFARVPGWLTSMTGGVDSATPKIQQLAQSLDSKVFDEWGPKLKEGIDALRDSGAIDGAVGTFKAFYTESKELAPSILDIATALGQATAALSVSGWQLFLTTLETSAAVLETINPLLSATAGFLRDNQALVTAFVAGWLAFKTIPGYVTTANGALSPLVSNLRDAGSSATGFGSAYRTSLDYVRQANPSISTAGAHLQVLRSNGISASGALSGLKSAGSGLVSVLGGPWNVALMGAGVLLATIASKTAEAREQQRAYEQAVKASADSQVELNEALLASRGAVNDDVLSAQGKVLANYRTELDATADKHMSWWDKVFSFSGSFDKDKTNAVNDAATSATEAKRALDQLGISDRSFALQITGSAGAYETLREKLRGLGEDGASALPWVEKQRTAFEQMRDVASRVAPGVTELGEAMRILGDKSSSASDKTKALKAALDALNPARSKGEAIAQHNEVMRQVAERTQEAIDKTKGFGRALLDNELGVNTTTANGAALRESLMSIVDATQSAAASGADMAERNKLNQQALQQLATQYGLSAEEIRAAADKLGLDDVEITVALKGAPEATQQLAAISQKWAETPEKKTLTVEESAVTKETRAALERMNIEVAQPKNGMVTITANDADARAKILLVSQNVSVLNALKANPQIDLNKSMFDAKDVAARNTLMSLDRTAVSPEAGLIIDQLLQGKQVSIAELTTLSQTTANPQVNLEIQKLMEKLGIVNTELDRTARPRQAFIDIIKRGDNPLTPGIPGGIIAGPPSSANGSIMLPAFADGGVRNLTQATTLPGSGKGRLFQTAAGTSRAAEGETRVESWIPWAANKRGRATDILATTAQAFGYALVPTENLPAGAPQLLGALTGGMAGRLLAMTGVDDQLIPRFADGGFRTADEVNRFPRENGLEGSPYVWAGVHWGDCSAAQSGVARYAVGLNPWGGRGSTAGFASYLPQLGFQLGRGSSGDLRIGWYNGGPGGGHTAGTLPDGTNIEMGGARGNGQVGGAAAGADDPQFTDHAFLRMAQPWSDPGNDDGGWVQRPDGTWVQLPPGAGYQYGANGGGASSGSGTSTFGTGNSISGRFGSAIGAFFEGQLADVFTTLNVNDQPGWLQAIVEYENAQNRGGDGSSTSSGPKLSKEERQRLQDERDSQTKSIKDEYEAQKLQRDQDYEAAKQKIDDDLTFKKIDKAEHDRRIADLKAKHDTDELAKQQERDRQIAEAKAKYDQATGKTGTDDLTSKQQGQSALLAMEQKYNQEKLGRDQAYDTERANRKVRYDADRKALQEQKKAGQLSKEQYEQRAAELKAKYEGDLATLKSKHENDELTKKQEYDRLTAMSKQQGGSTSPGGAPTVTDPGTTRPAPGQDLGPGGGAGAGTSSTGNAIKDAFRSGIRQAWRAGEQWAATDWIVNKESTWNPNARNGKYYGLGQYSPEVWSAAGIAPTPDPMSQGKVFDSYVGSPRYGTPTKAKEHHLNKGWYDVGGRLKQGPTLTLNELGHDETILPFEPEDLLSALAGWDGASDTLAAVHRAIDGDAGGGRGGRGPTFITHATFRDEAEYYQRDRRAKQTLIRRRSGGRVRNG